MMLELQNISVSFSAGHGVQAVRDVSLSVPDGSKIAIVGETGSGKSVLLLAVLRLLPKTAAVSGSAVLDGRNLFSLSEKELCAIRGSVISYVPQGGGSSMNPLYTVGYQVGEPLMEHRGYSRAQAFAASIPLLKRFSLGNEERLAHAYPHTFSGGMRQRAMVAMGISAGSKIIFADEPTKGLDPRRVELVAETLNLLENETLICVTHDLDFAAAISKTICVMYSGQQLESGDSAELLSNPLHPYTKAMVAAIPRNGMTVPPIFFKDAGTQDESSGCSFRRRCPYATERCSEMPPMLDLENRKVRCWMYAD